MSHHTAHPDWVLNSIIEIDRQSPGLCGEFFRASTERRHVIATYLAMKDMKPYRNELADFLMRERHDTILAAAYGERVAGLRGALRRAGPQVQEQRFYCVLGKLLSKPQHREVPRTIARLRRIDLTSLRVLNVLPEPICRANVVEALRDVSSARSLADACKLLVGAGIDEKELYQRVRSIGGSLSLSDVLDRILLKCQAPEHPVPLSNSYQPITSAEQLHALASEFRNCARSYTIELLDPDAGHAFAVVRLEAEKAVVHLQRRDGRWHVEGLFGPRNSGVSRAMREHIGDYLEAFGVASRYSGRPKTAWESVRRLTSTHRVWDFDQF